VGGRGAFLFSGFRHGARFNRATIGTDTVYRIIILGHKKMPPVLDGQYRGFNVSMGL
jgi:hypothetical protein